MSDSIYDEYLTLSNLELLKVEIIGRLLKLMDSTNLPDVDKSYFG